MNNFFVQMKKATGVPWYKMGKVKSAYIRRISSGFYTTCCQRGNKKKRRKEKDVALTVPKMQIYQICNFKKAGNDCSNLNFNERTDTSAIN